MENRAQNKTPNNNSKYMDHVYCHTGESKNYIRANNNNNANNNNPGGVSTTGSDVFALLKENKNLKAMLILHLDLIQEQGDQLIAKDKQIANLTEEMNGLRSQIIEKDTKVLDLQKQMQRYIKRASLTSGELSSLPPPPLAKIQCKSDMSMKNIIGECNGKLISKIILHRVAMPNRDDTHSPFSTTTASDTTSEADETINKINQSEDHEEHEEDYIQEISNTTEESNSTVSPEHSKNVHGEKSPSFHVPRGAKPRQPIIATTPPSAAPAKVCFTPPTPSRGKQMPLMLWHAPDLHSDESISCESALDTEQCSPSLTPPTPAKSPIEEKKTDVGNLAPPSSTRQQVSNRAKVRRNPYISTSQMYSTREWEDDEFLVENEFVGEEANALKADAPMLEIPKWTEHDLCVSYINEIAEDLSDDTFLKRHAKQEVDEKRRKKWDVQQIREQRRIEKLKRRHCKDELSAQSDQQSLTTFYPRADTIQTINFVTDLPVQAFGEMIPKLNNATDFTLPWLHGTPATIITNTSLATANLSNLTASTQQQFMNSSFVYIKKRRRQQSSQIPTTRQRSTTTSKAASAVTVLASVSAPPTITTSQITITRTPFTISDNNKEFINILPLN